jgi:hypothetical protein
VIKFICYDFHGIPRLNSHHSISTKTLLLNPSIYLFSQTAFSYSQDRASPHMINYLVCLVSNSLFDQRTENYCAIIPLINLIIIIMLHLIN